MKVPRMASGAVLLAAVALLAAAPAASAKRGGSFRVPIPKAGGISVTQLTLTLARRPRGKIRLKLAGRRGLPGGVQIVGAVHRTAKRRNTYVERVVVVRRKRGSRALAHAAQDLGFGAVNNQIPGVTNGGVTGSSPTSFLLNTTLAKQPPGSDEFCVLDVATGDFAGDAPQDLFGVPPGDPGAFAAQSIPLAGDAVCRPKQSADRVAPLFDFAGGAAPAPLAPVAELPTPFSILDLATGDFNGDGRMDIVAAENGPAGTGALVLYVGEGDGTFGLPQTLHLGGAPTSIAAGDVDLDGMTDLAVGEGAGVQVFTGFFLSSALLGGGPIATVFDDLFCPPSVIAGGPGGLFQGAPGASGLSPFAGFAPVSVAFGRLNDDPLGDVAAVDAGQLGVLAGGGDGSFGSPSLLGLSGPVSAVAPRAVSIGQANLPGDPTPAVDADLDVFVATQAGVEIFENQTPAGAAAPVFVPPVVLSAGTSPVGVLTTDLNGDSIPDVLGLNRGSGTVSTFLAAAPDTGYNAPLSALVGANPVALSAMSFDGAGAPDVVVASNPVFGGGEIEVFRSTGGGVFVPPPGSVPQPCPPPANDTVGDPLTEVPDITRDTTVDDNVFGGPEVMRSARAAGPTLAVTHAGRVTSVSVRGYGEQPSGTPIEFRVLRPQGDGSWVPMVTSNWVTLPTEDGVHTWTADQLNPAGADVFKVQPGDEIGVFQNADAPGHSPGDHTSWTIFHAKSSASMYEVSIPFGYNDGDRATPTTNKGIELLLQATIQPMACPDSNQQYQPCTADLVASTRPTGPVHRGKPATFVDRVRNDGVAAADGVTLTHGFPAGAKPGRLPAGCKLIGKAPPVARCTVGHLDKPGGAKTTAQLTFTMTPTRLGGFVNSVHAASSTPDPKPQNSSAASTLRVGSR